MPGNVLGAQGAAKKKTGQESLPLWSYRLVRGERRQTIDKIFSKLWYIER